MGIVREQGDLDRKQEFSHLSWEVHHDQLVLSFKGTFQDHFLFSGIDFVIQLMLIMAMN